MIRIFNDNLRPQGCSGLYTLMGSTGGQWHDIYTISGTRSGSIEVDAGLSIIDVDTSVFIPGTSYLFKWMDSNGTESNQTSLYIPAVLQAEDGADLLGEGQGAFVLEYK
jgi:hypothetical protein